MRDSFGRLVPMVLLIVSALATLTCSSTPDSAPTEFVCTGDTPDCPELVIEGDAAQSVAGFGLAPWRGFADPAIRRDPQTGRLWLTYSWPNTGVVPSEQAGVQPDLTGVVDIHLARSDDDGRTWHYEGPLLVGERTIDPGGSGQDVFLSYEVSTIAPREIDSGVIWYGAYLHYVISLGDGLRPLRPDSFHFRVSQVNSPTGLADADYVGLGGPLTAAGWNTSVNLSALSPRLAHCLLWNEPALLYHEETLYLAAVCLAFDVRTQEQHPERALVALFATEPDGEVNSWSWRYVGKLAGHDEAVELGGEHLLQVDLAHSKDGGLLAILSPSHVDELEIHHGCRILALESLDPPALARGDDGSLEVLAAINAPDLTEFGPGACGYEPSSETGILFTRREWSDEEMVWSIHTTGLRP